MYEEVRRLPYAKERVQESEASSSGKVEIEGVSPHVARRKMEIIRKLAASRIRMQLLSGRSAVDSSGLAMSLLRLLLLLQLQRRCLPSPLRTPPSASACAMWNFCTAYAAAGCRYLRRRAHLFGLSIAKTAFSVEATPCCFPNDMACHLPSRISIRRILRKR